MAEKLVVYYSRSGTTEKAAKKLTEFLGCDIEAIKSAKQYRGLFGWLAAGRGALRELSIEINKPVYKPEDYQTVIVCSPVWAGKIPPAVRTYLKESKDKIKNISYLLTLGGDTAEKPLSEFAKTGGAPVKTIYFSNSDRKTDSWIDKLKAYADELV